MDVINTFRQAYPYIACSDELIEESLNKTLNAPMGLKLDLMKDYILSQGMADVEP